MYVDTNHRFRFAEPPYKIIFLIKNFSLTNVKFTLNFCCLTYPLKSHTSYIVVPRISLANINQGKNFTIMDNELKRVKRMFDNLLLYEMKPLVEVLGCHVGKA